ncbi:hypothetical protein [Bartonella apihabitans]|uniref:hypothetical protein n=1 Tax=Bartonella apihabitans TaxID=2750929 RepID=UPI00122E1A16|nr:hypothetical protein [Bartonella apihabitans]
MHRKLTRHFGQFESQPQNLPGHPSGDGVSLVGDPNSTFVLLGLCPSFDIALFCLYNDRKTQNAKNRRPKNLLFSALQALPDKIMLAAHGNIVNIFINKEVR